MGRSNNFDALRLAGALAVLVSHQFLFMGRPQPMVTIYTLGQIALFVFFAISGYLVAGSWQSDPDGFRFIARRALRIGPGWFGLMLVTAVIHYGLFITTFPTNPEVAFNGSLWTLPWEMLCYAALGVSALFLGLRLASVLGFALLLVMYFLSHGNALLLMFAAGAVLRAFPPGRWLYIPVLGLLVASWIQSHPLPALLAVIPLLTVAIGNSSWRGVRDAGRFGDFSFGIYIYACPVQQFGVMLLGTDRPYLGMLAISLAATFALAFLSWKYVEAPGLALKARLHRQPQIPDAVKCAASLPGDTAARDIAN